MSMSRVRLGRRGEEMAAGFLKSSGCGILESNYRSPWGEIDLVATDGEELAFIEVRTRRSLAFGSPQESITQKKADHLVATAQHYLQNRAPENDGEEMPWRIDLVSVCLEGDQNTPLIDHVKYAIQG